MCSAGGLALANRPSSWDGGRTGEPAQSLEVGPGPAGALPLDGLAQRGVGGEDVIALEGGRLVDHVVGGGKCHRRAMVRLRTGRRDRSSVSHACPASDTSRSDGTDFVRCRSEWVYS